MFVCVCVFVAFHMRRFALASTVDFGSLTAEVARAQDLPLDTPLVNADKAYRGLPGVTTSLMAPEVPGASAEELEESVAKVAARQRVEGLNHIIKSWKVAALTFRPTNVHLHAECVVVAALLADYLHFLRHH